MEAVQQNMIANNLTPVYATHPGEIIRMNWSFVAYPNASLRRIWASVILS